MSSAKRIALLSVVSAAALVSLPNAANAAPGSVSLPSSGAFDGLRDELAGLAAARAAVAKNTTRACRDGGNAVSMAKTIRTANNLREPLVDSLQRLENIQGSLDDLPWTRPADREVVAQVVDGMTANTRALDLAVGEVEGLGGKPGDERVMGRLSMVAHRYCPPDADGVCVEGKEQAQRELCGAASAFAEGGPTIRGAMITFTAPGDVGLPTDERFDGVRLSLLSLPPAMRALDAAVGTACRGDGTQVKYSRTQAAAARAHKALSVYPRVLDGVRTDLGPLKWNRKEKARVNEDQERVGTMFRGFGFVAAGVAGTGLGGRPGDETVAGGMEMIATRSCPPEADVACRQRQFCEAVARVKDTVGRPGTGGSSPMG